MKSRLMTAGLAAGMAVALIVAVKKFAPAVAAKVGL
jgi:hypothetical protein